MKNLWHIRTPDPESVQTIRGCLHCSPIIATVLANRSIRSAEDAFAFMNTTFNTLSPPFSIKDMDAAVERISGAIIHHEKILVFGDYDVDGITATVILYEFLNYAGADVSFHIPHRINEGYGLQPFHISDIALPQKINLIITVDCGSGSHDAVALANDSGIDVVITDHHTVPENLPKAVAVINPGRPDCASGLGHLAGVGVAFYLLMNLRKHLRDINFWHDLPEPNLKHICDMVALGTLADMVPLVKENRTITKAGMEILKNTNRHGMNALIELCNINRESLNSDDIVFRLAPRLNAAGRMDYAKTAADLLMAQHTETAKQIARSLNQMNSERQQLEKKIINQILGWLKRDPVTPDIHSLVLAHESWHEGVLGIAASKLVERFCRPVVLLALQNGIGRGSARSTPNFDLYEGLAACSDNLISFGGHPMAAGLKIKAEDIHKFKHQFENTVKNSLKAENATSGIAIDYELNFDDITEKLVDELECLEPFGAANPEPLFLSKKVEITSSSIVGENHRRMTLRQPERNNHKPVNAIWFNADQSEPPIDFFETLVFRLRWNYWKNGKTVQIIVAETQ